ncbi:hypothetical protein Tco_0108707 [Tanacetum coccineum]
MSNGPSENEKTPSKSKGKGIADNEKTPSKGKGKGIAYNEKTPSKGNGKSLADESQPELWSSWMSLEKSFQIKSLYPDHKCSRSYNIGSLVTYKWIASYYAKDIINNPFITVSKLGEYRQVVLEFNPGSTCHLDVEEDEGCVYFKSFCVLLEAVRAWLPRAQHRQYTRHIYVNFKKMWYGLHYRRLFWAVTATTIMMSRALFETNNYSASFKNEISESFNSRILNARGKPIITMPEDIRIYLIQRTCVMSKFSIKPVHSSRKLKRNNNVPLLPLIIRKLSGRPRSRRIRYPIERDHYVNRAGGPITCQNYWERGHNRGSCKNPSRPKPPSNIQRPKRRKLGDSSIPGKGDGSGPLKATKGGNGDDTGPSKATKGGNGDGTSPSKAKKGVQGNRSDPSKPKKGDGSGPSNNDGKGKKVCHISGININEGQHMTHSQQEELFRQDQAALEDVIHEEERRKQMEWESNGMIYKTWFVHQTPVEAPNAVQAQHEVEAPNGVEAPSAVQASSEVQAPTVIQASSKVQEPIAVQAPSQTFVVNSASSRVLRPRS